MKTHQNIFFVTSLYIPIIVSHASSKKNNNNTIFRISFLSITEFAI